VRVVYFVERFWPLLGGVEVLSAALLRDLAARGHEVTVITGIDHEELPERDSYHGCAVHRLRLVPPIRDRDLETLVAVRGRVRALAHEARPDVVHAVFTGASIFYLKRSVLGDVPLIMSFHGSWPMVEFRPDAGLSHALSEAAWVTACSRSALEDLREMTPVVAGKSSVVLNGLDPASDAEPGPPPAGPPVLLVSGRVVFDKGFDVAVDAFAEVAAEFPGARLVVAGDGPEVEPLRARAAALGVAHGVEFRGWISPHAVAELVAETSIVVVPSRLEGFGLVALEAAHGARPVVAARVGGLPEVVEDGVTGLLVAPEDASAMAAAILALLRSPEDIVRMGTAARARALELFSARRHADEWEALYERL
jgi:glycosyltransferase involved in cell wall biosynthesis